MYLAWVICNVRLQIVFIPEFKIPLRGVRFSFMASPPRRGSKRPKRSGEDAASQPTKKHKAGTTDHPTHSNSNAPRRSGRAGAGTGGHTAQLERVGAQLEPSRPVSRPLTTFPNDVAENPVAPPLRKGRKKVT